MSNIQGLRMKDKELNSTYQYFQKLFAEYHSNLKAEDRLFGAYSLAMIKLDKVEKYIDYFRDNPMELYFIELIERGQNYILDSALKDDIRLDLDEILALEQLLKRAKEILIEEKEGKDNATITS